MHSAIPAAVAPALTGDGRERRSASPSWAAVCAWGAGLLCLALGAGAITGELPSARAAGIVVAVAGAATLAWGVAVLARGRIVTARSAIAGAVAVLAALAVAVSLDPVGVSVIAAAAASALLVIVALLVARALRRPAPGSAPRLGALMLAAVVVAGVVTPALGATEAARLAPDHGSHGVIDPGHH